MQDVIQVTKVLSTHPLVRGVYNDAAKSIADSLKLMLSMLSSSTAKKGPSTLCRATGRALMKKSARFFLPGTKTTRNWP
jgi:hypothetical protein